MSSMGKISMGKIFFLKEPSHQMDRDNVDMYGWIWPGWASRVVSEFLRE
jgi:hypothetical protein